MGCNIGRDVEKAFDRLHHSVLFDSLLDSSIDTRIGSAVGRLYRDMKGYVVL